MLKGIDPLLSPDLLRLLAEMGHDDALVLADANFIAMRPGAGTPVLRLPGVGLVRALQAGTSLLPLADDIPPAGCLNCGWAAPRRRTARRCSVKPSRCWPAWASIAGRPRAWNALRSTSARARLTPSSSPASCSPGEISFCAKA